jgi:hypothetical protein
LSARLRPDHNKYGAPAALGARLSAVLVGRPELPNGDPVRPELPAGDPVRPELPNGDPVRPELPAGDPVRPELPAGELSRAGKLEVKCHRYSTADASSGGPGEGCLTAERVRWPVGTAQSSSARRGGSPRICSRILDIGAGQESADGRVCPCHRYYSRQISVTRAVGCAGSAD